MFKGTSGFSRFMNMLAEILITGLLWVGLSIPVLTAGTATTAAYYAMAKSVRHKEGYVAKEFFHAFRSNVKQMLVLTGIYLVLIALLGYEIVLCWMNRSELTDALFVIEIGILLFLAGHAAWACPLLSRFNKTKWGLVKMAAVCMFRFLPITLMILILFAASVFGIVMTRGFGIWFIPGIYMFVVSIPMEWALRKLMPKVDPDSEEGQKWYYQDFKRKKECQTSK